MVWPVDPEVRLCGQLVELSLVELARDGAALFAALDDDSVDPHGEAPRGCPGVRRTARPGTRHGRPALGGQAMVVVASAGSVVGTSSYLDVSVHDARLEVGSTAYTPAVWASAVNPETKLLLLEHAFDVLGAGRVRA